MKLKQLEAQLQTVSKFANPKIQYEQYPTSAHIASQLLYTAANTYDDIEDTVVLDLGVGCGVLSAGAGLLGAAYNIGVDIDPDALEQAAVNCEDLDTVAQQIPIDLIRANVEDLLPEDGSTKSPQSRLWADTVIMNPPFGTKTKVGIDMVFLQVAFSIAETAVYSLHKSSTREFILKKAASWGWRGEVVAELRYDIPASYKFHKKKSVDVEVDFLRFEKLDEE
ncbi:Methyltransferase-like protein 5 [Rhizophlyctis rosea]|uniref:Methyltransferase-like protein 5 n=1 Tax=Rhizophlyctis rosea TaxID=64517 RepID=A0AAD5SHP3_9FUNG|nr:Methyltransferase-like protein 5 [Rhizophlyctis rosea]